MAFLEEKISRTEFQELAYTIDTMFIGNVQEFEKIMKNCSINYFTHEFAYGIFHFLKAGVIELYYKDTDVPAENGEGTGKVVQGRYYRPTPLGKLFHKEIIVC